MSILIQNTYGWFICCKTYFDLLYAHCEVEKSTVFRRYVLRNEFFEIKTPFLMNSQSKKFVKGQHVSEKYQKKKAAKLKKINEKQAYGKEKQEIIKKGTELLVSAAKSLRHLEDSEETNEEWFENNRKARAAASEVLNYSNESLGSRLLYESAALHPVVRKFGNDNYLIPPQASFHLCDISDFFQSVAEKYDLIVIDPPWLNKSVKRKHSYSQLKYDFLKKLAVEKIINPGCLIVVWITNSPSSSSFILNDLFPKCNIIHSTIWHWCKVTQKGKFVHPLESHHKKPYENIILGRVSYDPCSSIRPVQEIGPKKLIVSVPSSIHSHKPPLVEILKPYLLDNAHCLELFARFLLPKWKSVGNEVLKLQNSKLFDTEDF